MDMVENHSQIAASHDACPETWDNINSKLLPLLAPLHYQLANDVIDTAEAGDTFSTIVMGLLNTCNCIPYRSRTKRRSRLHSADKHKPRSIEKVLKVVTDEKNKARIDFRMNPSRFLNAVRLHHRILSVSRKSSFHKSALKQERAFRENPWEFTKSVCCNKAVVEPAFTSSACFDHFQSSFSSSSGPPYTELPEWVLKQF